MITLIRKTGGGGGGGGAPAVRTVALTLDDLNAAVPAPRANGTPGAIQVGTWPNSHRELLEWDSAANGGAGGWIGTPIDVITQSDTWAMDLRDKSGAELVDWAPILEAVPYGGPMAILDGAHDLSSAAFTGGTGVVTCESVQPPAGHAERTFDSPNGRIRIRDNYITYTNVTALTFTGCTTVGGSGGTVPDGLIVSQGRPGGFGLVTATIPFAGDLWGAGLRLQEWLLSHMNASPEAGNPKLTIAPYWFELDDADGFPALAAPPVGGIGLSTQLQGPASSGGGIYGERNFYLVDTDWQTWPLPMITKRHLVPKLYGKMEAGAKETGQLLDTVLRLRWVGGG